VNVDVAETTVGRPSQPKFLLLRAERRVLAAIFDGSGSWGNGPDAAALVLKSVRARWQDALDSLTPERLCADLNAASRELPDDLRDDVDDCSFSLALALAEGREVALVGAGVFSGLVLGAQPAAPSRWHARPRMLVDDLLERGQLTAEDVPSASVPDVCVGPFLGGVSDVSFYVGRDHLAPGERLLLTHFKLLEQLDAQRPPRDASAATLQALSARPHPETLMVLTPSA
jgi:hypothetical protein